MSAKWQSDISRNQYGLRKTNLVLLEQEKNLSIISIGI